MRSIFTSLVTATVLATGLLVSQPVAAQDARSEEQIRAELEAAIEEAETTLQEMETEKDNAQALGGRGCPNWYNPFAYVWQTAVVPDGRLYIRIHAWDNDYPAGPLLKVFINGSLYTTFTNGFFEGYVNPGIGKIVFKHPGRNQCGSIGVDVEVAKIPWF